MSYYGKNIWGIDGIRDESISPLIWYKDIILCRNDFEKIGLQNEAKAISCFIKAVDEFNNVDNYVDLKNKANIYLINEAKKVYEKLKIR